MKQILVSSVFLASLLLVLPSGAQAKEKQIKLEDIEHDNLAAERRAKHHHHQQPPHLNNQYLPKSLYQLSYLPPAAGTPTPPKMQYGFVPMKTPSNYLPPVYQPYQQQQQQQHQQLKPSQLQVHLQQQLQQLQQEYQYVMPSNAQHSHTQAYFTTPTTHPQQQQQPRPHQHYQQQVVEPQETYAQPIQTQAYHQYLQLQQQKPQQQQQQHQEQQQQQIQYVPASQLQQYHYQEIQQQPQVQYVVDNSIQQQPSDADVQKYYQQQQPQYVYLQPYQTSSASNNIQAIADTKGNLQYVMYIPTSSVYPHQHTETVLAYPTSPGPHQETQYVYQPAPVAESTKEQTPETSVDYVDEKPTYRRVERPMFKHQPTSLLDSYVPSYLQYQFYKQQQHDTANAIKQSIKLTSATDVGKADVVKNYKNEGDNSNSAH